MFTIFKGKVGKQVKKVLGQRIKDATKTYKMEIRNAEREKAEALKDFIASQERVHDKFCYDSLNKCVDSVLKS